MIRKHTSSSRRSGVVLLVVITLLALFAAMGLSFVFYAEGESQAAEINSLAENKTRVDLDPELLLSFFLGQSLYGGPSHFSGNSTTPSGLYSANRGHDMATNLFGFNYAALTPNSVPFNGVGKIGAPTLPAGWTFPAGTSYADILNLTYYPQDRFIIDPERLSVRSGNYPAVMSAPLVGPYVGWNPSYSYADMNNLFLGAMDASGELLAPSFFRLFANPAAPGAFLPMDPTNTVAYANWTKTDPWWKYLTARPHPSVHPNFPLPMGGGDVKNLDFGPGLKNPSGGYYPMDSIWMDLGWGVMTGPDGRKYKPLFAPLIISLDGKINVNACGNIRAAGNVHASNQGLGPWEISLMPFFNQTDYQNLFLGNPSSTIYGRYYASSGTTNSTPGVKGTSAMTAVGPPAVPSGLATLPGSLSPSIQGPLDLDCVTSTGAQTKKVTIPGEVSTTPSYFGFPNYPTGWDTFGQWNLLTNGLGQSATSAAQLLNHQSLYDFFHPSYNGALNSKFRDSNMEALLRYRGTGSLSLSSNLQRLCLTPTTSLNDPTGHNRMCITTRSFSFGVPTASPWISVPPTFPVLPGTYQIGGSAASPMGTVPYPQGSPIPFPTLTAPPSAGEFGSGTWNYNQALLKRVNLNRPLTPYPAPNRIVTTTPAPAGVIDPTNYGQFTQALQDRQKLAQDIFNVLTQVTIGGQPALPAGPILNTDPRYPAYQSLLWLAQLSVNIVDFIDDDNYITAFNWNPNDTTNGWVYGTEQPRLVINEVYSEIVNSPADLFPMGMAGMPYNVNSWVELVNPLSADPAIVDVSTGGFGVVRLEMPAGSGVARYPIYTLSASTQPAAQLFLNPQLGTPNPNVPPLPVAVTSYSATVNNTLQTVGPVGTNYTGTEASNNGFYVIGPAGLGAQNPFKITGANKMTPTLASNMTYPVPTTAPMLPNTNFFLQRLACPDLPPQANPALPMYNPYVTVDYFTFTSAQLQANDARTYGPAMQVPIAAKSRHSYGRMQPFGGAQSMNMQQLPKPALANEPQTTLFRHNAREKAAPPSSATAGQTLAIPFNWLVHMDRQVTSPLELLHVSAYPPYQLTQLFQYAQAPFASTYGHASMPAWFDDGARIYRALEFFDAGIRATAIDPYTSTSNPSGQPIPLTGRIPGRVNINEIWDKKQLRALCDPQTGLSTFTQAQVDLIFTSIMNSRSPAGQPSPFDRPFKGMAAGNLPSAVIGGIPFNYGIEDTFLRPGINVVWNPTVPQLNSPVPTRLLAIPNQTMTMNIGGVATTVLPPSNYVQMELMNKIFNNITCQSNVFAVWLTVGFFDVTDGPVTTASSATTSGGVSSIVVPAVTGTQLGVPWVIQKGCGLWVDGEPMAVKSVAPAVPSGFTVTFWRPFVNPGAHGPGSVVSMKGVLGGEVGLSEGRNVRHRMFCIVDRSALSVPSALTQVPGTVLQKSAVAPPSATVTPPLIVLPQGQVGSIYNPPPTATPPGYTVFVPGGPFHAKTVLNAGGTGLTATIANKSSWVTFSGTPIASPTPTSYFSIVFHKETGGTVKQYFKISVPQSATVALSQLNGTANVNFPGQWTPEVGPSLNVNYSWKIQQGMNLVISGFDANNPTVPISETITVTAVTGNNITAIFANAYAAGAWLLLPGQPGVVPNSILGNPGPQPLFDHRLNTALVPHYSIIQ